MSFGKATSKVIDYPSWYNFNDGVIICDFCQVQQGRNGKGLLIEKNGYPVLVICPSCLESQRKKLSDHV